MTSHTNCTHPATKAARAACRKAAAEAPAKAWALLLAISEHPNFPEVASTMGFTPEDLTDDQVRSVADMLEGDFGWVRP